jgi:hypothetical protein
MMSHNLRVAVPALIMGGSYWLSSVPGTPLPDDPAFYAVFVWMPSSVQNALHVPAFAGLALAWSWALAAWVHAESAAAIGAFAITATYAVLDEWHQSLVPGRFASLTDIAFDIGGTAFGVWLWVRLGFGRRHSQATNGPCDSDSS